MFEYMYNSNQPRAMHIVDQLIVANIVNTNSTELDYFSSTFSSFTSNVIAILMSICDKIDDISLTILKILKE